jgi:hypothetical protein
MTNKVTDFKKEQTTNTFTVFVTTGFGEIKQFRPMPICDLSEKRCLYNKSIFCCRCIFSRKNTLERIFRDVQGATFHPIPAWEQYQFMGNDFGGCLDACSQLTSIT